MERRPWKLAALVATIAMVVSCAGEDGGITDQPGDTNEAVDLDDAFDPAGVTYECFGVAVTAEELETAPTVAELDDHPGAATFAASTDDPAEWRAVLVEDERLGAIREKPEPEILDGEVRDHERLVVEHLGDAAGEEGGEDGWMVTSAGPCALRPELEDLAPATVLLDPDAPPEAEDTTISLWVVEQACAGGQPATDRVEVSVGEADDEIRLVVGVAPLEGEATCPSNPPTPITIELDEPLGDRELVDAARLPTIPVEVAPDELAGR